MKNLFRISGVILLILSIFLIHSCKKKEEVPVITTTAVSNITATTATSGGNITSDGGATVITRGVCWSTGTTPTIADNKTTDGAGAGSFSSSLTVLNGATNYYVRAYASNSTGTGYGMAMSFTTLGQPPTPTGSEATNINATGATLNGSVNANYLSTVVTFEYGTTTSYGTTVTATQSPVTGNTNTNASVDITGLNTATIYHYRVKAVNSLGTTYGNDITFTTLGQVPTVTTQAATNTTTVTTQINGTVNGNYLATIVTFEYGTTTSYGSTITATQSPLTGNTNVSASITGLTTATIYHYRVKAVNSLGTTYGNDITFTTLGQIPTVTTQAATNRTTVAAQLNGTVNANYLSTVVTFQYGTTTSYGNTVVAIQSPVTGSTSTNANASITGLTEGTTYHYRSAAVNVLGTSYGNDITFTTLGQVPTATTQAATSILTTSATLNGIINANYLSTSVTFEYGSTTSYGNIVTATQSPVSGNTNTNVSADLISLSVSTIYHFRVKTVNSLGTTYGNDMSFTTDATTVTDIDGNTYQIIRIGSQVWMAENLKVIHYKDGSNIPNVTDNNAWKTLGSAAYCWYNNDEATYKITYGALYNWYCVVDNRKICPTSWHIPTDAEWTILSTFLGGTSVAGGKMKTIGSIEQGNGLWRAPNTSADNSSGFSGIPAMVRYDNGLFPTVGASVAVGYYTLFWSNTEYSITEAWCRDLAYDDSNLSPGYATKKWGVSIRCVRDY